MLVETAIVSPKAGGYVDQAINAAAECFRRKGVRQTNMADVARAANMARSTLYKYFKDRDELVVSVIEREALSMAGEILPRLQKCRSIETWIVESILLALKEIEANPTLSTIVKGDTSSNQLLLATDRIFKLCIEMARPGLEKMRAEGGLNEAVEIEQLVDWVMRILISFLTLPSEATATEEKKRKLLNAMLVPALV